MTIFVTGTAGFIGFHLTKKIIENNIPVVGFDNVNDYYDVNLKLARLKELDTLAKSNNVNYNFVKGDLEDKDLLELLFKKFKVKKVVNLAAQAGVRYSIENPSAYIQSNIVGFGNILECCRNFEIEHLIYASSSSVYGGNEKLPFSENDNVVVNTQVKLFLNSRCNVKKSIESCCFLQQLTANTLPNMPVNNVNGYTPTSTKLPTLYLR